MAVPQPPADIRGDAREGDDAIPRATFAIKGKEGYIKVGQFDPRGGDTEFETRDYKAHDSSVVCTAISLDGKYCATASIKGTLIRIFSTETGVQNKELRRGSSNATITSITFSPDNSFLAVTSDHGTVHIFATGLGNDANSGDAHSKAKNTTSWFKFTQLGITKSEWSPCSFTVPPNSSLCFAVDNNGDNSSTRLIVVKENGEYSSHLICTDGNEVTAAEEMTSVNLLTFSK